MNYVIEGKQVDILKEDWKYLALLDGCRYDYFKELHMEILDRGNLKKAECTSLGTPRWMKETFEGKDCKDIIILTTSINFDYRLPNHTFFKAVNVWKEGWSERLGTTPPQAVNKAFLKEFDKHPTKRFILHYMQPHTPYITIGGQPTNTIAKHLAQERTESHKYLSDLMSESTAWTIKKLLGRKPTLPIEAYFMENGKKGLKEVYKNEIRLVLTYVKKLIDSHQGKWVLTADHGVRVGEKGRFGQCHVDVKEVREVPWMVIDNV